MKANRFERSRRDRLYARQRDDVRRLAQKGLFDAHQRALCERLHQARSFRQAKAAAVRIGYENRHSRGRMTDAGRPGEFGEPPEGAFAVRPSSGRGGGRAWEPEDPDFSEEPETGKPDGDGLRRAA